MVHRNLGWAYYRTNNDVAKAIASYEKAVACNAKDPRLFTELDQLYELGNVDPDKRLAILEKNRDGRANATTAICGWIWRAGAGRAV